MDRHDLTDLPQHFERLQEQKKSLQDAQSRKGQRPALEPRMKTVVRFRLMLLQKAGSVNDSTMHYVGSSFVPSPYPPCETPFSELTKVAIQELVLETQHRGKYLLVRCVTPQDRMTAVLAIVEDEGGDVLLLQLYHQEQAGETLEDILTEGAVLIIKEPYFKATANGGYALRVDHVSDIVFLTADDARVPEAWRWVSGTSTAMAWKAKGNDNFNATKYRAAIEAYTRALDCSPTVEGRTTITLNRSLAYIKTKAFEKALSDVESTTSSAARTEKALFRKAQALYGLQRFRESCEVLKALRLEYPNNNTAKADLDRAIGRLFEQSHGRYDFKKMYAEAARLRPPQLDHATYIGPVAIKDSGISPGGRGMFTTQHVSAGDLLFCEKAFAHAFVDESASGLSRLNTTILIDAMSNRVTIGTEPELTNMVVQKLCRNPSLASIITNLHHGSYEPVEATSVDGVPVVDTFLIRRIIALNSFGSPLNSRESHLGLGSGKKSEFHSSGIWPQASYINHNCLSNARRSFIGDMMIVRASRNLAPDTELTWWYQPPETVPTPYLEHQKPLLRTWGFMCKCAICRDMRDTPKSVIQQREQLRSQFRALIPTRVGSQTRSLVSGRPVGVGALKKADALVKRLNATYKKPASQVPRLAVADLQLVLAREWEERGQLVETARFALGALESFGFVIEGGSLPQRAREQPLMVKEWGLMMDNVIDCWMFLRRSYRVLAPELASAAERFAKVSYRICIGEDDTFEGTLGQTY
ncbi:hypothetical protein B0T16DRAFT_112784 [Cercophora newfieldiana]|uniref:SET domain-containing protein n=1 Tax=Cercophora newfieldiana TaxID=92897 RepID=A0AA39Y8Q7_9PEZI|nr:hypothetical protein B0T16DRAFT_112784 [Cercophora newfieldiana]